MVEGDRLPVLRATPFCAAGCEACTVGCATLMAIRDHLQRDIDQLQQQLARVDAEAIRVRPLSKPTRH